MYMCTCRLQGRNLVNRNDTLPICKGLGVGVGVGVGGCSFEVNDVL